MKDFLCYTDSTFDFGNSGVALLSGPSGVGKTSILRGIFFALFGEGNKLQASGSSSCRVELEFDDLIIIRTKRPNRTKQKTKRPKQTKDQTNFKKTQDKVQRTKR